MDHPAFTDDVGRSIHLEVTPRRVVSLVPSLTELLFDLGAGERLIGVTRYCIEPADGLADVERVGGTKNPALDRIVELAPDLVLVDRDENRREDFDALAAAGIPVFVAAPQTVAGTVASILRVGRALRRETDAEALATALGEELAEGAEANKEPVRVFCPIWRNPWMSFNGSTYAADLIRCAGGVNVCDQAADTYPQVDLEEVAALNPEVVLLPDEPYVFGKKHIEDLKPLERSPAWQQQRIHLVDGKAMFWYGRRTIGALPYLRKLVGQASA